MINLEELEKVAKDGIANRPLLATNDARIAIEPEDLYALIQKLKELSKWDGHIRQCVNGCPACQQWLQSRGQGFLERRT